MARKPKPMPLEGVNLNDLLPNEAPTSGTTTRRPQPTGSVMPWNRRVDWTAETAGRTPQRDLRAEDALVDSETSKVVRSSLDGRGLATERPGHFTGDDLWRAPLDAIKSEMFTYDIARWLMSDSGDGPDPNFRWNPENIATYTKGIPEESVDYILEAESDAEAAKRRARVEELLESRENLANLGGFGSALSLTAGILDPVGWIGGGAGVLAKGGRLARMTKGGLYAGATAAGQFAAFGSISPVEDEADALTAIAMSFVLGTAAGGIHNPRAALAAHDAATEAEIAGMAKSGFKITEAGKQFYADARERFREMAGMKPGEDNPSGARYGGASSAGAMERDGTLDTLRSDPITGTKAFDQLRSVEDEDFSVGGRLRLDVVGKLRQSLNPATRVMAKMLDIDAVGASKGGSVAHLGTAAERQRRYMQSVIGEAADGLDRVYREYADRQGWTFLRRQQGKRDFYARLVEYMRSRGEMPDPGNDLAKAAEVWRNSMRKGHARLREAGVDGADRFEPDDWYVPRQWSTAKIEGAVARFGVEKVEGLLAASLRSAWRADAGDHLRLPGTAIDAPNVRTIGTYTDELDELPQDKADKIARAMLNRIRRITSGVEANGIDATRHTRDQLRDLLAEAGLEPDDLERIVERIAPKKDSANFSRLKNRTLLDDGYSEVLKPRDTDLRESLSIHNLLEDDGAKIMANYHAGVGSYSAMAELGVQSFGAFERMANELRSHVGVVKGYTAAMADADVRRVIYLGKRIFGVPVEDLGSSATRISKVLRDVNFARNMGQAGAANIADIAVVVAETGFNTVKQHMPDVWKTVNAIRRGEDLQGLDRELSTLLGVGRHSKRDDLVPAYEDLDEMMLTHSAKADWIGRVGDYAQTASRYVGKLSGFNFVTDFLNVTAARASVQQIADIVMDVKKPSKGLPVRRTSGIEIEPQGRMDPSVEVSAEREAAWGIAPEDKTAWKDLFLNAEFDSQGVILRMNYEKMKAADPAAFARLVDYLDRRVHTMVLEPTPGMLHEAFGTTVGKIFLQFRGFPFASTFAHGLNGIALRDRIAAQKLVYSMATASLVYSLQASVRSIGRSDRQEYLEKRLAPEEIIKAAFQRSAVAGLAPSLVDSAYGLVSNDPVFAYGRTTDLASGFVTGNPTVDLITDAYSSAAAPGQSALSGTRQYSEGDARTALSILPFQNVWGIQNALQIGTSVLPDTRQQEPPDDGPKQPQGGGGRNN